MVWMADVVKCPAVNWLTNSFHEQSPHHTPVIGLEKIHESVEEADGVTAAIPNGVPQTPPDIATSNLCKYPIEKVRRNLHCRRIAHPDSHCAGKSVFLDSESHSSTVAGRRN